ncbi:MAG: MarR family transcriptional regulator [Alphaproteobacteria bacterium]|nr:MAG: MarR family transcriptional regulator [Alphaproteobacteria bacterium]
MLFTLLNEIGIIEQLARTRFEAAQEDGLKLAHFILLNHLMRLGDGKSPVALARAFQVTKGAITNTMHRLEERGLITITPDDVDGRGKRVWLTDAGRARRTAAVASLAPAFADLGTVLSEAEIRTLLEPLSRLRKALDARR